jgi:predicted metal-binding protein
MTLIKQVKKFKPCKRADVGKVSAEIALVATLLINPIEAQQSSYRVHKVPVNGVECLVADAKTLNKFTNQSGRGNLRYLFDPGSKEYIGLAQEKDDGCYRKVA